MLLAGASLLALMAGAGGASATTFDFTGTVQHFTIVTSGLYDIEGAGRRRRRTRVLWFFFRRRRR